MDQKHSEALRVKIALRNSERAREAIGTLMDRRLHWNLNLTTSESIFRIACIYQMLDEEGSLSDDLVSDASGYNPTLAIGMINEVYKRGVFDANYDGSQLEIPLTKLPEAIRTAFGCMISITLDATEGKLVTLGKVEMSDDCLDAEQGTNIACMMYHILTYLYRITSSFF